MHGVSAIIDQIGERLDGATPSARAESSCVVRLRRFHLLSALLCAAPPLAAAPIPSAEPAQVVTEPDAGAPAPPDTVDPAPGAAQSSIGSVEFEWVAPAQCPSQAAVIDDARSLIAHQPNPDRERMRARAVAVHEPDGQWRLNMDVGASSRTVEGASCEELARAAALFLALLVDPIQREAAAALTLPDTRPERPAKAVADRAPSRAARTRSTLLEIGAGVTADVGTLPHATVLGTLSVGAWFGRARLAVAIAAGLAQDVIESDTTVARLTPSMLNASGCYGWRAGALLEWGPCLSSELGVMRSETVGLTNGGKNAWMWWGAGGAWLIAARPTRALRVEASLGGVVPIVHPSFRVEGVGVVYEQRAAARGALVAAMVF